MRCVRNWPRCPSDFWTTEKSSSSSKILFLRPSTKSCFMGKKWKWGFDFVENECKVATYYCWWGIPENCGKRQTGQTLNKTRWGLPPGFFFSTCFSPACACSETVQAAAERGEKTDVDGIFITNYGDKSSSPSTTSLGISPWFLSNLRSVQILISFKTELRVIT